MQLVIAGLNAIGGALGSAFSSTPTTMEGMNAQAGIKNSPKGFGTSWVKHSGGIVGSDGPTRSVSSSVFSNAIRAHNGLMPNERPIIATKDEGIFTPGQMKALGGRSEKSEKTDQLLESILAQLIRRQTVNAVVVDSRDVVTQKMMEGREGENLVMNHVARNNPNEQGG